MDIASREPEVAADRGRRTSDRANTDDRWSDRRDAVAVANRVDAGCVAVEPGRLLTSRHGDGPAGRPRSGPDRAAAAPRGNPPHRADAPRRPAGARRGWPRQLGIPPTSSWATRRRFAGH